MKQASHFTDFLNDVVNLNDTRITQLEESISAIKDAVRALDWKPKIKTFEAQGSWAHKTIIKPVEGAPFDADLLVYVDPVDGWEAKDYVDNLYSALCSHGTYKGKTKRYSHCATIEYSDDRKIDIAPCVVNRGGFTRLEVCNRETNQFERSEPRKYTDWLIDCNARSGSNSFRKVTRLLKYLRDIKGNFTCSSVLLTTLLGQRIYATDKDSAEFGDVPSALKTIVGRLDNWLQANPNIPAIQNPFLATENFSASWDDTKYANFRDKIQLYRSWIDDAYNEADRDESIGKWRRVFGDDFAKSVVLEEARAVSSKALVLLKSAALAASDLAGDLVALVKRFGARALPSGFQNLPHMHRPRWRALQAPELTVSITATLHGSEGGNAIRDVKSLEPLDRGYWLKFQSRSQVGSPIPASNYDVRWRVTNTDQAAFDAGQMRGEFNASTDGTTRWEKLAYRGVHLVEAFVLRRRDKVLVARSAPFFVVIN